MQESSNTHLQVTILSISEISVVGGEKVILEGGNSISRGRMMSLEDDILLICSTAYLGTQMAQNLAGIDVHWVLLWAQLLKLMSR